RRSGAPERISQPDAAHGWSATHSRPAIGARRLCLGPEPLTDGVMKTRADSASRARQARRPDTDPVGAEHIARTCSTSGFGSLAVRGVGSRTRRPALLSLRNARPTQCPAHVDGICKRDLGCLLPYRTNSMKSILVLTGLIATL